MKSPFLQVGCDCAKQNVLGNLVIVVEISISVGPNTPQIYKPLVDSDVLIGITAF
jgi:hypothetical protein